MDTLSTRLHSFIIRCKAFLVIGWNLVSGVVHRLRLLLLLLPLCILVICLGVYAGLRSYAPVAAREAPTATSTAFQPATAAPIGFHPSPTPFQSPSPTPLPSVTSVMVHFYQTPAAFDPARPWAPYAGPIHPASTQIPPPVEAFELGPDVLNIALLGVDRVEPSAAYRTDTIMILSLNRARKTAALISIPRDLFVYIPAYGMQRINIAFSKGREIHYPGGGFALFQDTIRYNFGLQVDRYAMMDFQGFKDMVNALDGIDVYVSRELTDKRLGYVQFTLAAGEAHLDGATALWYSRSRYTTSDFDRQRRQQEVLQAIAQRLLSINALDNIPGFFQTFAQYVESDLTLDDLTPYLELGFTLSPSSIGRYQITAPQGCRGWTSPEGMMVLLPNFDVIHAMLEGALIP